jgi:hypothetical protein
LGDGASREGYTFVDINVAFFLFRGAGIERFESDRLIVFFDSINDEAGDGEAKEESRRDRMDLVDDIPEVSSKACVDAVPPLRVEFDG